MGLRVFDRESLPEGGGSVALAIGTFDGVHLGHLHIIEGLIRLSNEVGASPMAVMFDHPPAHFFNPALPRELITLPEERLPLLEDAGIEVVLKLAFCDDIAGMKAREFLSWINSSFDVRGLVVGFSHRIGSDRVDSDDDYGRICSELGMTFNRIGQKNISRWTVSSTLVRQVIREARLRAASIFLRRHHSISGSVIPGEHLGARALACPTANILLSKEKLSPPPGVYAGIARFTDDGGEERSFNAAVNIMPARIKEVYGEEPPDRMLIEAHLVGFEGDLYGKFLELDFVRRIRPERRFRDLARLKAQIEKDIGRVIELDPLTAAIPSGEEAALVLEEEGLE